MITIWNFDISCLKTMTRIKTISHHDQETSVFECQHHQASNIIHWVIIAATNLQCTILHKLYYLRCRDFLKIVTGHLDTKHNWSKKWAQTIGTTKKATSCSVLRIKGCIPLGWSASGSEITRIVVDQMNRWIHSGQGFIGSVYLSLSEWSQITDPDLDHPKGKHPKCILKSDLVSKKQQLQKEDDPVWEYNSKWRSDHHSNIVIAI